MEKIMDILYLVRGISQRRNRPSPILSCAVYRTDTISPDYYGYQNEYYLKTELGIQFQANSAQLPDEMRRVKRVFANRLYGDINGFVEEIQHEIICGDLGRAVELCKIILEYTKEETR